MTAYWSCIVCSFVSAAPGRCPDAACPGSRVNLMERSERTARTPEETLAAYALVAEFRRQRGVSH